MKTIKIYVFYKHIDRVKKMNASIKMSNQFLRSNSKQFSEKIQLI